MELIFRELNAHVQHGLQTERVVAIMGPRQAGKTTLVQHQLKSERPFQYYNLKDPDIRRVRPHLWRHGLHRALRPRFPHCLCRTLAPRPGPRRQLPPVRRRRGANPRRQPPRLGRTDAEVDQILATAAEFLPQLQTASIREVRRGRRPIPRDGLPVLGFATFNLYLATMHSGVTLAALVGECAASEILDGTRIDFLEPYRLARFFAQPA